jgi:glycosyltransferase involved in cell wall biosynthesis
MSERIPRLTIGVPVYNGEKYLRATLDSLLAQTYTDFQLFITDNASTDSTPQICQEYAAKDSRVIYVPNEKNLGPAGNFNVSVDRANTELFKWCAADDMCGPDFVKRCIEALDADPTAVSAYPRTKIVDGDGAFVRDYDYELNLSLPKPHQRLKELVFVSHRQHGAHELWGVMRLAKLREAGKKRCHVRADSVLLVRLCLLGKLVRVEDFQFFNRDHQARSSRYLGKKQVRANSRLSAYIGVGPLPSAEWWDAKYKGKIVFPDWRVMQEYFRSVSQIPLTSSDRRWCHWTMIQYVIHHIPKLGRDLIIATEQVLTIAWRKISARFSGPNTAASQPTT